MRTIGVVCLLTLAAGLVAASGAWAQGGAGAQGTRPPPEAFGRLPAVSEVAISPDGRRVALAESNAEGLAWVSVVNLDNPSERTMHGLPQRTQLRRVGWVDDNYVSFQIDRAYAVRQIPLPGGYTWRNPERRVDIFRWGVINLATGRARMLFTDPEKEWADWGAALVAPIGGDQGFVRLIGGNTNFDRGNAAIYRVNLQNGRSHRLSPSGTNQDTLWYELDEQGRPAARLDSDGQSNRWRVFVYEGDAPRLLVEGTTPDGRPPSIEGLLPDGRVVIAAPASDENGFRGLYAYNRATGARETLFAREGIDISGAINDPWTRQVIGVAGTGDAGDRRYFGADLQRAYETAKGALGESARLVDWSRDRSRFIVYVERGLDGGVFHLFTPAANSMRRLGSRYPELAQAAGERQSINYRARDGVSIPAILTFPAGERRNLPLVLLPHGGPHMVHDDLSFDWWTAFLVSRGYVVLQPNYRGSGGYGEAWQKAGYRQWGGLMQRDLEDGVDALARAGVIDPARVCIVGASYGGYAALAGATMTPQRYRCAISVAGVSDLSQMLLDVERSTGGDESMASDWWRQSIGDREEDRAAVRAASPVHLADRVAAPVLLIHGTDDTVVPIDQSRRMVRALEGAGKQVRFVELRGDDHWLSDAPTRIQMLREIETFLAAHLPVQ